MVNDILSQLLRDEGFRDSPYLDTRGISTVGVGHNLVANPLPGEQYPMSLRRGKDILLADVNRITGKLVSELPWIDSLPDARKGVLQNMAFNLGVGGLLEFKNTLHEIQVTNYVGAADGMMQSAWYKQVGARAQRLVNQMLTGEWV